VELNDIRQVVELMDEHGLSFFKLEQEGVNLEMKKGGDIESVKELLASMPSVAAAPAPIAAAPVAAAAPAVAAAAAPAAAPAAGGGADGEAILSPMVGTFYRKPNPDSPNFVEVGDTISEGQTICIIEAMKVMNEIKAERSGTITQICVDESTPVQFEDALFMIK